jgi:hypothetical protein
MYRKANLNIANLTKQYTIDTDGCVFNVTDGKPLKGTSVTQNNRYVKIHLDKFYPLHRLVAMHFIPNPDNLPQVNHVNGNRNDNRAENLEWCSARANVLHAYSTGLKHNRGETNPCSVLSEEQVRQIWALRHSGLTARQIVDRLNLPVGVMAVKHVRSGKSWVHVTGGSV